jgi:cytochrome c oxidase cbb3-type subunit 2
MGEQQPQQNEMTGNFYPTQRPGQARQGAEVYRANGCYYCHTQQVRPRELGGDIERGWAPRRTVGRDFLYDQPVMLGSLRIGPDLANVGARLPDEAWHLRHLYDPKIEVEDSVMPPYRYLFRKQIAGGRPSPDALELSGENAPEPGYEIVPTYEAKVLVAYLLSLRTDQALFEAPIPQESDEENGESSVQSSGDEQDQEQEQEQDQEQEQGQGKSSNPSDSQGNSSSNSSEQ